MSYFTCSHGEVYHPFGQVCKRKLLKAMTSVSQNLESEEKIDVSIHSFPLINAMGQLSDDDTGNMFVNSDDDDDGREGNGEGVEEGEGSVNFSAKNTFPLVMREPNSELSNKFLNLANGVVKSVFMQQLKSQTVSEVYICVYM